MRRGALPTGVDHVPAPDPEVAIHLPTEDLPLHATSHLHAMLCRAIVRPQGGTRRSTIAHRHVITDRKVLSFVEELRKRFCNSTFYFILIF